MLAGKHFNPLSQSLVPFQIFVLFFGTVLIQGSLELLVLLSIWDNKSGPPGLPYPLMFLVVDILRWVHVVQAGFTS